MTEATYFLAVNSGSSCKEVEDIPAEHVQTVLDAMRKAMLRLVSEKRAGSLRENIIIASYWENSVLGQRWVAGFSEPRRYRPGSGLGVDNADEPKPSILFRRRYLTTNEPEPLFEIVGSYKDAYIVWPADGVAEACNYATSGNDAVTITEDDLLAFRDALESICKDKQAERDERYGNGGR